MKIERVKKLECAKVDFDDGGLFGHARIMDAGLGVALWYRVEDGGHTLVGIVDSHELEGLYQEYTQKGEQS